MNQSTKTKSQQVSLMSGNKNINLPKLDRIIIKNNPSYKNPIYQPDLEQGEQREKLALRHVLLN